VFGLNSPTTATFTVPRQPHSGRASIPVRDILYMLPTWLDLEESSCEGRPEQPDGLMESNRNLESSAGQKDCVIYTQLRSSFNEDIVDLSAGLIFRFS